MKVKELKMIRNKKPWENLVVSLDDEDIAIAWVNGALSTKQANIGMGFDPYSGRCTGKIAKIVRKMKMENRLICKKKKV